MNQESFTAGKSWAESKATVDQLMCVVGFRDEALNCEVPISQTCLSGYLKYLEVSQNGPDEDEAFMEGVRSHWESIKEREMRKSVQSAQSDLNKAIDRYNAALEEVDKARDRLEISMDTAQSALGGSYISTGVYLFLPRPLETVSVDLPVLPPHRQVRIKWEGAEAEVDSDIAPLILELWKAGLTTCNSCQEQDYRWEGKTWIEFSTLEEAKVFLKLVGHDSIRKSDWGSGRGTGQDEGWEYNVYRSLDANGHPIEPCSVRFPRSDLDSVLQRVRGRQTS